MQLLSLPVTLMYKPTATTVCWCARQSIPQNVRRPASVIISCQDVQMTPGTDHDPKKCQLGFELSQVAINCNKLWHSPKAIYVQNSGNWP